MALSFFEEAIASLPLLLWDTAFPPEQLSYNRPYRNAGDLLVKQSPVVRNALRLCGCDASIVNGEASDYECFSALCAAAPLLIGNRALVAVEGLLKRVFEWEAPLSPYEAEALWDAFNAIIEDKQLRPSHILEAWGVESLCYRVPALASPFTVSLPGVDLYPIFNLSDPLSVLAALPASCETMEEAFFTLSARLDTLLSQGCVSVRMTLPKSYQFFRNSRKKEVDRLLLRLKTGESLAAEEENQLLTSLLIAMAHRIKETNLPLLLETETEETALIQLYDYLALNQIVPETLLITERPKAYKVFFGRHTDRTEKGLPSLMPVSEDISALIRDFPIGTAILPCHDACDIVSLAEGYHGRSSLTKLLEELDSDPETLMSLAEDVAYGNVKNRFSI